MRRTAFVVLAGFVVAVLLSSSCLAQGKGLRLPKKSTPEEQALLTAVNAKPVDLSLADTPILDAVNYLRGLSGVNIVLIGDKLRERKATLEVQGVSLSSAVGLMAGPEGACGVVGNALCIGGAKDVDALVKSTLLAPDDPTPEAAELIETLDKKRIDVSFESTPMQDIVSFLSSLTKLNIVLIGAKMKETRRTVELRRATLRTVLRLASGVEGRCAVIGNCLCLGKAKDVEAVFSKKAVIPDNPKENEVALYGALKDKRLDLSFESTPLRDAVNYLREIAQCNLVADEKVAETRKITMTVRKASLDTILRLICGPELNYGIAHEVLYISTGERLKKMVGEE
ncbi:MAG: hypothetical protein GXP25_20995 [Planctomycetes bacterium]|nr:hypothetical protein [Planctomycetota bacterium]